MPLTAHELALLERLEVADIALEECGELIQAIVKYKRHGDRAIGPTGIHYDNLWNMAREYKQVAEAMEELCAKHGEQLSYLADNGREMRGF